MDWNAAIEKNREALRRIVAGLVAMAGLAGVSLLPRRGGDRDAAKAHDAGITLPRHLRLAVLSLLRPAEAATRRLIVVMARGLVVTPPARRRKPKPKLVAVEPLLRSLGIAVTMAPADLARAAAAERAAALRAARPRGLRLPLLDPLPRLFRIRRPTVPPYAAPRILLPGRTEAFSLPPPPSPHDPVSATGLALRLAALGRALDDLPGQARRLARWRAAASAAAKGARPAGRRRFRRIWPLRPGRPPGWRRKPLHPVHDVLDVTHGLAIWALEVPDTS